MTLARKRKSKNSTANNPGDVMLKCDNSDDVSDKVMIKVEKDESDFVNIITSTDSPNCVLVDFDSKASHNKNPENEINERYSVDS